MLANVKPLIPARIRRRIFKQKNINELPIELLADIFLFCLPIDAFPRPSRHMAPIILGRICRFWRSVSLNTPGLWAQVTLRQWPRCYETHHEFESHGINEWLRRSKTFPLSFEMVAHPSPDTHDCDRALGTIALLSQTHRWKLVSLRQNCKCIDRILKVLWTPGKTPMLTEIRFIDMHMGPFQSYGPIPCARQIRSLYIHSQDNPFLNDGRFRGLRELRIGPRTWSFCHFIFTQFPMLEVLEIIYWACLPPYNTGTVVTLPHLHTFIFKDPYVWAQLSLLDLFDTPALTSFATSIQNFRKFSERTRLSNFLMRCGGQLQQLKLEGNCRSLDEIHDLIRHTPVLKSLYVAGMTFPENLTTLCPPLLQINVIVLIPMRQDGTVAVDFIISHWKNRVLKTLARTRSSYTISVPHCGLPEVLGHRKVKKYIQQGLRICHDEEQWWNGRR